MLFRSQQALLLGILRVAIDFSLTYHSLNTFSDFQTERVVGRVHRHYSVFRTLFCQSSRFQFQLILPPINIFKRLNHTRAMYKLLLSHELWCYTGICGSEKSRNNTREKISYSFTCVDIANQPHLPLAPLDQVDE